MTPGPLSTARFYGNAKTAMGGLSARADQLQNQIATGKRLDAPSDDTIAYQRLQRLARATTDQIGYSANTDLAASLLQQTDTTLTAMATQIQQAAELVVKAGNGTYDATARRTMGLELSAIVDSLVQLANTTDTRGQPLLGGVDGKPAVTRIDGGFAFSQGTPAAIPVADGQSVLATETASRVFDLGGGKDTLTVLAAMALRLEIGGTLDGAEGGDALDYLKAAEDQLGAVRGSVGVRAARVDMVDTQATQVATDREAERAGLEDTDLTAAIADLQQTMTVLSATQASFSKLSGLSLFDYLR